MIPVAAVAGPLAIAPAAQSIPAELRGLPAWVLWRYRWKAERKKWDKIPYYVDGAPRSGRQGTAEDLGRLTTFDEAAKAAKARGKGWGLGIAMNAQWGVVGLDFDKCIDNGVVRADVENLVAGTYAEVSPSGTGIRAFMRGSAPDRKDLNSRFEVFHAAAFLTVTGNVLPVCEIVNGGEICDLTESIKALITEKFGSASRIPPERAAIDDPLMTYEPTLGLTINELRVLLEKLDPNASYDEWLKVGMALHHEAGGAAHGLDLWDDHSMKGSAYVGREDLEHRYAGFGRGGQSPITARYLRRLARSASPERHVLNPKEPMESARVMARSVYENDQGRTLQHFTGIWFIHKADRYAEVSADAMRAAMWQFLDQGVRPTSTGLVPFEPDSATVSNAIDALKAVAHASSDVTPFWLPGFAGPTALDLCAMQNGLLHLPTRRLVPLTPGFFNTNSVPFGWDANAPAPRAWLKFLNDLWSDDPEMVDCLQQFFGYALTSDTRQQKIFLLLGPKRSGKGTIARVLTALLGTHNVVGPTMSSFAGEFGMQQLINKQLAIFPDARVAGDATKRATVVERLLLISGEDTATVDRKHIASWTGKLPTRLLILTNEMPRLGDASGALASRFVVLETRRTFFGQEDHALEGRVMAELPGILLWALDGRDRLASVGRFHQPRSALETVHEFEDLNSPVSQFVRERCLTSGEVECGRSSRRGAIGFLHAAACTQATTRRSDATCAPPCPISEWSSTE